MILKEGQIPSAQGALYTPTQRIKLTMVALVNGSGGTEVTSLYLHADGKTARLWKNFTFAAGEHADYHPDSDNMFLNPGDSIEAVSTTAAAVDFTIKGEYV